MNKYIVYTYEANPDTILAEWIEFEGGRLDFFCADPDPDLSPDIVASYACGKWLKFVRVENLVN